MDTDTNTTTRSRSSKVEQRPRNAQVDGSSPVRELQFLKARDIIPGWPRGRSTHSWGRSDWSYMALLWGWGSDEREAEHLWTMAYHDRQQKMVNAYFERWRKQQPSSRQYFGKSTGPAVRPVFPAQHSCLNS